MTSRNRPIDFEQMRTIRKVANLIVSKWWGHQINDYNWDQIQADIEKAIADPDATAVGISAEKYRRTKTKR